MDIFWIKNSISSICDPISPHVSTITLHTDWPPSENNVRMIKPLIKPIITQQSTSAIPVIGRSLHCSGSYTTRPYHHNHGGREVKKNEDVTKWDGLEPSEKKTCDWGAFSPPRLQKKSQKWIALKQTNKPKQNAALQQSTIGAYAPHECRAWWTCACLTGWEGWGELCAVASDELMSYGHFQVTVFARCT